jgi:hypothetical protein
MRRPSSVSALIREIVGQQWNFSPSNTIREAEEYEVQLPDVTVLELIVVPHISGGCSRISQEYASALILPEFYPPPFPLNHSEKRTAWPS